MISEYRYGEVNTIVGQVTEISQRKKPKQV